MYVSFLRIKLHVPQKRALPETATLISMHMRVCMSIYIYSYIHIHVSIQFSQTGHAHFYIYFPGLDLLTF